MMLARPSMDCRRSKLVPIVAPSLIMTGWPLLPDCRRNVASTPTAGIGWGESGWGRWWVPFPNGRPDRKLQDVRTQLDSGGSIRADQGFGMAARMCICRVVVCETNQVKCGCMNGFDARRGHWAGSGRALGDIRLRPGGRDPG